VKIKERAEYSSKPKPLTGPPDQDVLSAVQAMSSKNFGSIVVVNPDHTIAGLVTERDIYRRLVAEGRDATTTTLSEIMTANIRVASEDDELLDWLRIMSNERFRRLPITDEDGKLVAMMSQGDFVSYTWPELMTQATTLARSGLKDAYYPALIALGIGLYTIAITLVL